MFICRFYHIFQGYSFKNLHFPHIKHCPNSFAIKRRRKSVDRSPKWFLRTSKQLFAIHLHCLPSDDPRVLCANTGIRLLANHSLMRKSTLFKGVPTKLFYHGRRTSLIWWILCLVDGFHTEQACSSWGRTKVVYAFDLARTRSAA